STPAVLTNHELLSLSYQNRFKKTSWASRAKLKTMASWMRMFNYEERMLRLFDGVVVLTRPEREFISQYVPGVKAYNHPTGVDCDFFTPGSDEIEPGTVLFVGNFRHFPNVGGMLWFLEYVWPKVCCTYPGARLHIVGGNPPKAISYAHGHNGVVVTGWVEDVRPYFRRSAVFVAPVFEGVGLRGKILEAWAMQKAVVGTQLSFEALNASDGGTCFIADTADLFVQRVC